MSASSVPGGVRGVGGGERDDGRGSDFDFFVPHAALGAGEEEEGREEREEWFQRPHSPLLRAYGAQVRKKKGAVEKKRSEGSGESAGRKGGRSKSKVAGGEGKGGGVKVSGTVAGRRKVGAAKGGSGDGGIGKRLGKKKGGDVSIEELLAAHNSKFKAKPAYEPRKHSIRQVRAWEKTSGKKYAELSFAEREIANEEIESMTKK